MTKDWDNINEEWEANTHNYYADTLVRIREMRDENSRLKNELNESEIKNDGLTKTVERLKAEKREVEKYAEHQRERVTNLDKMLNIQVKTYWELANKYVDLRSAKETVKYVFPEDHVFLKGLIPSDKAQDRPL